MIGNAGRTDRFNQRGHVFRRRVLRNAVAQIKYVAAALAVTREYRGRFALDGLRRRQQDGWIQIAL